MTTIHDRMRGPAPKPKSKGYASAAPIPVSDPPKAARESEATPDTSRAVDG